MKTLVVALGLVGLAVAPALAQQKQEFTEVDLDRSGLVSLEEAQDAGWTEEEFFEADADGDEYLNPEEFAAATAG